jgi:hypothetical protein
MTTTIATTTTAMLTTFPALYLCPPNANSFVKHTYLTNIHAIPAENNSYFNSKVTS